MKTNKSNQTVKRENIAYKIREKIKRKQIGIKYIFKKPNKKNSRKMKNITSLVKQKRIKI